MQSDKSRCTRHRLLTHPGSIGLFSGFSGAPGSAMRYAVAIPRRDRGSRRHGGNARTRWPVPKTALAGVATATFTMPMVVP